MLHSMNRSVKSFRWIAPALALAMVFGGSATTRAEDAPVAKGSITGTVVDSAGKPVAGATVRLIAAKKGGPAAVKPSEGLMTIDQGAVELKKEKPAADAGADKAKTKPVSVAETTTDSDGKFTLSDIPAGKYAVAARVKGAGAGREVVTVEAGKAATVTVTIKEKPAKAG